MATDLGRSRASAGVKYETFLEEKLDQARKVLPAKADLNPSTAHLFIVNPFSGDLFASLFSTHPPTEERVRRLRQMAGLAD